MASSLQTIKKVKRGDTPPSSSGNTHQWHTGILGCWCPKLKQSSLQESHTLKIQKLKDTKHHKHFLSILCNTKSYCFILNPNITLSPHFCPGHQVFPISVSVCFENSVMLCSREFRVLGQRSPTSLHSARIPCVLPWPAQLQHVLLITAMFRYRSSP